MVIYIISALAQWTPTPLSYSVAVDATVPSSSVAVGASPALLSVAVQTDLDPVPFAGTGLEFDSPRVSFLQDAVPENSFGLPMRESSPLADLGGAGLTFLLGNQPAEDPAVVSQSLSPGDLVIDVSRSGAFLLPPSPSLPQMVDRATSPVRVDRLVDDVAPSPSLDDVASSSIDEVVADAGI